MRGRVLGLTILVGDVFDGGGSKTLAQEKFSILPLDTLCHLLAMTRERGSEKTHFSPKILDSGEGMSTLEAT